MQPTEQLHSCSWYHTVDTRPCGPRQAAVASLQAKNLVRSSRPRLTSYTGLGISRTPGAMSHRREVEAPRFRRTLNTPKKGHGGSSDERPFFPTAPQKTAAVYEPVILLSFAWRTSRGHCRAVLIPARMPYGILPASFTIRSRSGLNSGDQPHSRFNR
jgi:hypothetical protein